MSLKQIWAPWRMDYLEEGKTKEKNAGGCVFCDLPKEKDDRKNLILCRTKSLFVILNKYPYNNGHLMVVPYSHVSRIPLLSDDETKEMALMMKQAVKILEDVYECGGFNTGMNLGEAGGAGIKGHLHLHVVPRWVGDTNFMPVLAETKSLPQHLLSCYDRLAEPFKPYSAG